MAERAALDDQTIRAVNEKHGDDHGVNRDTAAKLLALLICRPKAFDRNELDVMLRAARTPKAHDWLANSRGRGISRDHAPAVGV